MDRNPVPYASSSNVSGAQSKVGRISDAGQITPSSSASSLLSSTPRSYVPASLGIGSPNGPTKSLSERLKLSKTASASSSSSRVRPSDGLQFPNARSSERGPNESGSFPSIPSWDSQSQHTRSNPPSRLSASSSTGSIGSASSSSSSRNFLIPIGATGARQKLSIANASQRRRLAASEDDKLPVGSQSVSDGSGLNRSQSHFHNSAAANGPGQILQRSSSYGVLGSNAASNGTGPPRPTSDAPVSSAEMMRQAAMQRLSSQRILPTSKTRSASDNLQTTRATSDSQPSGAPADGVPPSFITTVAARPTTVTVPGRTTSNIRPSSRDVQPSAVKVDEKRGGSGSQQTAQSVDRDDDRSISAPPLTLAESYKRSMLERDAVKGSPTSSSDLPAAKPAPLPAQKAAPTLDLDLPSSGFFFDDDSSQAGGSHSTPPRPAFVNAARNGETAESKMRDLYSRVDSKAATQSTVSQSNGKHVPTSASKPSMQAGADSFVLQSNNREAMDGQDAGRGGTLARSYLALGDDEDESVDGQAKPVRQQEAVTPRTSQPQTQQSDASASTSGRVPKSAGGPSQTPQAQPAEKNLAQMGPPGDDPRKPKPELESYILSPSRIGTQSLTRALSPIDSDDPDRPGLPRETSLKTICSPPHKLEREPGSQEGAALIAGAAAATSTSPHTASAEASTTKQTATYSPAINGERTIQAQDEGQDGSRWGRSQDALAAFSPAQQSRFSEASTDLSDSRAPTRNENRFSGRASSISSGDGLEEESIDGHMLPTSAWQEVENALRRFRDRAVSAPADRGNLLRAILLPFLALEAETATVDVIGSGAYVKGKARRALFFDWINSLLLELQHVQTSADRGAILESIACIIESRNFSATILSTDPEDEARFSSVFGHILSYAIGELNKKGVYQNTLIFSGRLLAVAFFRVDGVASKLLRALPVNRFALERVAREFDWQTKRPTDFNKFVNRFPPTLRQLCYKDSRDYLKMLDSESIAGAGSGPDPAADDDRFLVCQPEVEVEMSGNWLRRWQSDDSELFFSFCRSYHRQLASLFASSKSLESASKYFFGGPGYAHLATCVHQKCLALVHRVILSVTTLSSQKNFNPAGETANVLSGSTAGKPRILEAANRRCTAIVVDIVRAPAGTNMIFAPMLGLHIKALIKRTSLYDVQGVFCLLDWLDGVISHMDSNDLINEGLVDISFIITTISMLLEHADHALALMRTIAFCYANFGVLTATTENRVYFCEQILLKPSVFHKLFLSWSFTIRAYYLHLLVFRLARIRDFPPPRDDPTGRTAIRVVRLFNQRLEALRKRHDSLSPEIDSSSDDNKSEDSKSRQSGTSTFVSTIKRTSTEGTAASSEGSLEARPKAEKIKTMTAANPATSPSAKAEAKKSGQSKTKNWLKAFRGNSSKDLKQDAGRVSTSAITGKDGSAEMDDDAKTIGSSRTTPRNSFESASSEMSDASTLAGGVLGGRTSKPGGKFEFDIKQQPAPQQQQNLASQTLAVSTGATGVNAGSLSPTHDAGIAKDTVFDLQSTHTHHPPTPGKAPQSPRVSKAFSRRASMLPGPASELVASMLEGESGGVPPVPELPADHFGLGLSGMNGDSAEVYDETLHIYAVQSLREYEQTVQEHDEFFASLPEDQSAQVPRLPVNWPAMWSSTGE